jgi:hypothetical protein
MRSGWRIWAGPAALGLSMASGLASALVCDGWGDRWAWATLALPLLAAAWRARPRS